MNPIVKRVKLTKEIMGLSIFYPDMYSCTDAFFRIDELGNYSKKFRHKHISREEILDRYCKRTGRVDYHEQWSGYCVDGKSIYRVTDNCHDLSDKERELKIICFDYEVDLDTIVIACRLNDKNTYNHELAHAYYAVNYKYRLAISSAIRNLNYEKEFKQELINIGYSKPSTRDEMQAFIIGGNYNSLVSRKTEAIFKEHEKEFHTIFHNAVKGNYNK
jgi:hypothetical protein